MSVSLYHGQFCRNPLHPGPCKGWKKGGGTKTDPAPAKKPAAPPAPAKKDNPARSPIALKFPKKDSTAPRNLVKPYSKIGKPSKTGKADFAVNQAVMQADWKDHNNSLTVHQRNAVNLYSTGAHHYINRYMRTPEGEKPEPAPQTGNMKGVNLETQAKRLQESMAPAPRGTKVFRGMGFRSAGLGMDPTDAEVRALVGKKMKTDNFTSTSVSRDQAFQGFERGIQLELEVPKGTPSLWLNGNSDLPWEQELLLASGATIEYTDAVKTMVGGAPVWKIKARVVAS